MPTDGLTKSLPAQQQAQFVNQLNLVDILTQLSGNSTQLSRNSGGDSSNSSGYSQLGAEAVDLEDGEGIAYFGDF